MKLRLSLQTLAQHYIKTCKGEPETQVISTNTHTTLH